MPLLFQCQSFEGVHLPLSALLHAILPVLRAEVRVVVTDLEIEQIASIVF